MAEVGTYHEVARNMDMVDHRPIKPLTFDGPLPKPTEDQGQLRKDLARAGYAIAANVFSGQTALEMREFVAAAIAEEERTNESSVRGFYTDNDDLNRRFSGPQLMNRHKFFREIVEHPLPLQFTKEMLGPQTLNDSYLVHSYGVNMTRPGSLAQGIHRDRSGAMPLSAGIMQTRFIWCLDDFDDENGATRVVPGSHLDAEPQDWSLHYESVPAEAPAGSVVIYDDLLLHGAGANRSKDRERAGAIIGYCPPWWKPMINFPMTMDPAAMEGSSVRLRQLLGYSSTSVGFEYPWEFAPPEVRALIVPPAMDW